jgi:hypothetical protein
VSAHAPRLRFDGLNFSSIKRVDFGCLDEEQTAAVMKLALQSQHYLNLKFSEGGISMKLLRHKLMKRASHLDASSSNCNDTPSTSLLENLIVSL